MGGLLSSLMGRLRGVPKDAASHLEALSRHADKIMGAPAQHLHEKYSPDPHIELLHYAPHADRDFHYVITSGMSDRPMTDNSRPAEYPLLELVMALPRHWDVSPNGFKKPATWQPFKLLKSLARYPHENHTFFAKGHTVPLGTDPLYDPMKAVLLMPPVLVPELAEPLDCENGDVIHFLALYLLRADELKLKLEDFGTLLDKFAEHEMTEIYDLERPSVIS